MREIVRHHQSSYYMREISTQNPEKDESDVLGLMKPRLVKVDEENSQKHLCYEYSKPT